MKRSQPATLINASTGPTSVSTVSIAPATAAVSATSSPMPRCPAPESPAANCAAASGSTSITATCQPVAASRWQTAAPIVPAPPVTIATLRSRAVIGDSVVAVNGAGSWIDGCHHDVMQELGQPGLDVVVITGEPLVGQIHLRQAPVHLVGRSCKTARSTRGAGAASSFASADPGGTPARLACARSASSASPSALIAIQSCLLNCETGGQADFSVVQAHSPLPRRAARSTTRIASTPATIAAATGRRDGSGPIRGTGGGPATGFGALATVDFACAAASFAAEARSPLVSASFAAVGACLGGAFFAGAFLAAFAGSFLAGGAGGSAAGGTGSGLGADGAFSAAGCAASGLSSGRSC